MVNHFYCHAIFDVPSTRFRTLKLSLEIEAQPWYVLLLKSCTVEYFLECMCSKYQWVVSWSRDSSIFSAGSQAVSIFPEMAVRFETVIPLTPMRWNGLLDVEMHLFTRPRWGGCNKACAWLTKLHSVFHGSNFFRGSEESEDGDYMGWK